MNTDVLRRWSWGLLASIMMLPGGAAALPGRADSPSFLVDTVPPAVAITGAWDDVILPAGVAVVFTWNRSGEGNDPVDLQDSALVLVNGAVLDSTTFSGRSETSLGWNWVPPELSSGDCRLVVRSRDPLGNTAADTSGVFSIVPSSTETPGLPLRYRLPPPRPNPFNPATSVQFTLPEPTAVRLAVFDERGRRLAVLTAGVLPAGDHLVRWDGRDDAGRRLPGGLYLLRLEAAGRPSLNRKVVLLP